MREAVKMLIFVHGVDVVTQLSAGDRCRRKKFLLVSSPSSPVTPAPGVQGVVGDLD